MASSENDTPEREECTKCKKEVTSFVKCIICSNVYHPSCAQRINPYIKCCNNEKANKTTQSEINLKFSEECDTELYKYLKLLVEEQRISNSLLQEKILILENELKSEKSKFNNLLLNFNDVKNKFIQKTDTAFEINSEGRRTNIVTDKNKEKKFTPKKTLECERNNNSDLSSRKKTLNENVNKESPKKFKQFRNKNRNASEIENRQIEIMSDLINISDEIFVSPAKEIGGNKTRKDSTLFKEVTRKRAKNRVWHVGNADIKDSNENSGFVGSAQIKEKRVWLFLRHVKDHVTEEIIRNYLAEKCENKEIISVENIKTFYQRKDNKCFKVGLEYKLKERVYETTFWPKGVEVSRYNFKKDRNNEKAEHENFQLENRSQVKP